MGGVQKKDPIADNIKDEDSEEWFRALTAKMKHTGNRRRNWVATGDEKTKPSTKQKIQLIKTLRKLPKIKQNKTYRGTMENTGGNDSRKHQICDTEGRNRLNAQGWRGRWGTGEDWTDNRPSLTVRKNIKKGKWKKQNLKQKTKPDHKERGKK